MYGNWYDLSNRSNRTFVMYSKGPNGSCASSSLDLCYGLDSQWRTNNTEIASECLTVYQTILKTHLTALPNRETAIRIAGKLRRNVRKMICYMNFVSMVFCRGIFQLYSLFLEDQTITRKIMRDHFISQRTRFEWIYVIFISLSQINFRSLRANLELDDCN